MELKQISIDLKVHKAIEQRRESFSETPNEVLRRVFKLGPAKRKVSEGHNGGLHVKGVYLREGLRLRKKFKGRLIEAVVSQNSIQCEGRSYPSPAMAARTIAGHSINAWTWWQYFDEDAGTWRVLDSLRKGQ